MNNYIETDKSLAEFVEKLSGVSWIALDTEFLREKTYYPRLCLLQIATVNESVCIDPLAINDLSPLLDILYDQSIVKVLHAAHQDLEIFLHIGGKVPSPIFDTQIVSAVIGLGEQISYARLIEAKLSVQLSKTHSRSDWSRRPLSEAQINYALDDVIYLAQVYPMLVKELEDKDRVSWLDADFDRLMSVETYKLDPRLRWKKVRGLQILKRQQLSVLQGLAAWREILAEKKNLPRKWIVADELLIDLSRQTPKTVDELQQIRGFSPERLKNHQKTLIEIISTSLDKPEDEWPELPRKKKPTPSQNLIIDLLLIALNHKAKEFNISPGAIGTRKDIAKMVQQKETTFADDWRGEIVNGLFSDVLNGRKKFLIDDGLLAIE